MQPVIYIGANSSVSSFDPESDLPAGWVLHTSRSTGLIYYEDTRTGRTQFESPPLLPPEQARPKTPRPTTAQRPLKKKQGGGCCAASPRPASSLPGSNLVEEVIVVGAAEEERPRAPQSAAELRLELAGLRLSELKRRSKALGATQEEVDEALDAGDPKASLSALIVLRSGYTAPASAPASAAVEETAAAQPAVATPVASAGEARRAELAGLKLSELRKLAAAAGVEEGLVNIALDAEEPHIAAIDMILAAEATTHKSSMAGPPQTKVRATDTEKETQRAIEQLRLQLVGKKLSVLRREALAEGVAEAVIDGAIDEAEERGTDPQVALVELLLSAMLPLP